MVNGRETRTDLGEAGTVGRELERTERAMKSQDQILCESKGGTWDLITKTCILPPKEPELLPPPKVPEATLKTPETFIDPRTGGLSGIELPERGPFLGLSPDEVREIAARETARGVPPVGAAPVGTAQAALRQQVTGQQLAGQVGMVQPSIGITPTELDVKEALTVGVVGSIPSAIRTGGTFAAGGAAIGAGVGIIGGPAAPITIPAAAAIGASIGFVAGVTSGMISNMKGQRTDNTNAQQRVLDEGKQTLKDWSTMAKADPANRELYLSLFNKQLQLIQDAHVQMITDTNADVAKFESAIPNLAEFNSFYSVGGERDALVNDMMMSLQTPVSVDYSMMELAQRRVGL